ncbi:unnamed protein product [Candidula unifasciata]|uniref:Uncharacterized protein n=1 Tax=Candidula unifasciata TaxID=100452 RepID=A0A8S3YZB3_9EUPU|nr:unnamed protein product [Candidula unifasciata]
MFCLATGVVIFVVAIVYIVLDTIIRSLKVGDITDKYVFITGCDSGFGYLAAKQLDKLGFHVFAGCLTKEGATSVTESCSSRVTTVELDIRSTESIQQAVKLVESRLPPNTGLWALLNNAGVMGRCAPAEMCSREDIQETLSVNLLGPIDVIRHFLPLIRKSKGRIVITTSMGARVAILPTPYTVSKYGLNGFSDRLRREVMRQGIKVSIVEPGAFRTPIMNTDKSVQGVQEVYDKHSPDIQAIYGGPELMNIVRNVLSTTKSTATEDLRLVVNAYVHAITSRFPRTRYRPGWDAVWFYNPVSYLPDSLADLVLSPAA